jgi:hypothetical protein
MHGMVMSKDDDPMHSCTAYVFEHEFHCVGNAFFFAWNRMPPRSMICQFTAETRFAKSISIVELLVKYPHSASDENPRRRGSLTVRPG